MKSSKRHAAYVRLNTGLHFEKLGVEFLRSSPNRPRLGVAHLHDFQGNIRCSQRRFFMKLFWSFRPGHHVHVSALGFLEKFASGEWPYFSKSDPNLFVHERPGTL